MVANTPAWSGLSHQYGSSRSTCISVTGEGDPGSVTSSMCIPKEPAAKAYVWLEIANTSMSTGAISEPKESRSSSRLPTAASDIVPGSSPASCPRAGETTATARAVAKTGSRNGPDSS